MLFDNEPHGSSRGADGPRTDGRPSVYVIAYQTVPPSPPDATTRALLPQPAPTPSLCALLAGRGVYGEAVQVEHGAG